MRDGLKFSRRRFLASAAATGLVGMAASSRFSAVRSAVAAEPEPRVLRAATRTIDVNGKPARVFGLLQSDGTSGLVLPAGRFRIRLENQGIRGDVPLPI